MKIFTGIIDTMTFLKSCREQGFSVGFVPTMGALHEGHLNLVKRAKQENVVTVCSIFVNPIQFNNRDDLLKYPRNVSRDLKLLEAVKCDAVFTPETAEMYPGGEPTVQVMDFGMLDKVMEGKFRKDHFKGVAIVVKKLFDIIQPTRAYFGKKDYQQLVIIRHMVKYLELPVEIISCDTVRDSDGLALSSRNARLGQAERRLAPTIYKVLLKVRQMAGQMPISELKSWAIKKIEEEPSLHVEYLEIGDKESLLAVDDWRSKDRAVAFVAVFLGGVRLIDNIELFS